MASGLVRGGWNRHFKGMAGYRSFLFPEAELGTEHAVLDARESHHLVRVFRAQAGDSVELLDGRGRRYAGRLVEANGKAARVAIESVTEHPRGTLPVTLVQAIPKGKGDGFDPADGCGIGRGGDPADFHRAGRGAAFG
ncbi:MAG: RNA methyltransferase PUA domain-containing protein [Opitutales bacterium]